MAAPPSVPPPSGPRFLVVGCGGIGGIVAAHLFEQGHDVVALTRNPAIADAINANGFSVRGDSSPGVVRGHAVQELTARDGKFDFILLCTQPPQVEDAARSALPHLAEGGAMVCFQNGLCEERIAKMAGGGRTLGAIVAWGASMLEPGVYDRTSAGGFAIGRLDGQSDPRLETLGRALESIGPVTQTTNLAGARWSKLAINCAISSLGTVGGDRLGVLMRARHVRRLALEIMTEVVHIARAQGIRLEKVSGTIDLDWIALTDDERAVAGSAGLFAKHALLLAVGARYRRLRSSMLAAIERGRPPAVDFLNGEVVSRGRELGVPTPVNEAIRAQVLDIARGSARSSHAQLRGFFDRTRKLVDPAALAAAAAAARPAPAAGAPVADTMEEAPLPGARPGPARPITMAVAASPPAPMAATEAAAPLAALAAAPPAQPAVTDEAPPLYAALEPPPPLEAEPEPVVEEEPPPAPAPVEPPAAEPAPVAAAAPVDPAPVDADDAKT